MNFSNPPEAQAELGESTRVSGRIKWFNRSKGFGFIIPDDGGGDVFLPMTVLERSGQNSAPEGATVIVDAVQGPKGRSAAALHSLDASTAAAPAPHPRDGQGMAGPAETLDGVVKWYDMTRGFGFILPSDGGKDIFVHAMALRRSGLEELAPGHQVRMQVALAPRGREAVSIELL